MLLDFGAGGVPNEGFAIFFQDIDLTVRMVIFSAKSLTGVAPHWIINTDMTESYYIAKVYRQHNSFVIVVPRPVCVGLNLRAGDHIVFIWNTAEGRFDAKKFVPEGVENARDAGHTDQSDRSRAEPAEVGR